MNHEIRWNQAISTSVSVGCVRIKAYTSSCVHPRYSVVIISHLFETRSRSGIGLQEITRRLAHAPLFDTSRLRYGTITDF